MRVMKVWLFMMVMTVSLCFADEPNLMIFLYDQPFQGDYFLKDHEIFVERGALLSALDQNEVIPGSLQAKHHKKTYVNLQGYAKLSHGVLSINWETGIVDLNTPIYANPITAGPIVVLPPKDSTVQPIDRPFQNNSLLESIPYYSLSGGYPLVAPPGYAGRFNYYYPYPPAGVTPPNRTSVIHPFRPSSQYPPVVRAPGTWY